MFNEVITPLIFDLREQYYISVTILDLSMTDELFKVLEEFKKIKIIRDYFIIPSKSKTYEYNFLRNH